MRNRVLFWSLLILAAHVVGHSMIPPASAGVVRRKVILMPDPERKGAFKVVGEAQVPSSSDRVPASGPVTDTGSLPPPPTPVTDAPEELNSLAPTAVDSASAEVPTPVRTRPRGKLAVFQELPPPEMLDSPRSLPLRRNHEWHFQVGADFSYSLTQRQTGLFAVGYQHRFTDFFLRGRMGRTLWGLIEARPGPADSIFEMERPALDYPSSEYNRARGKSDLWTTTEVQLGVGTRGNLLPVSLPGFSQAFHVTLGSGSFTDTKNSLQFTPYLLGFEASLQKHFGTAAEWAIEGRVGYQYGYLHLTADSRQVNRLPVRWLDAGVSLVYWF